MSIDREEPGTEPRDHLALGRLGRWGGTGQEIGSSRDTGGNRDVCDLDAKWRRVGGPLDQVR